MVEEWGIIPARKKADSEGLRRFESDEVDSSCAEHVMPSPMIELIRGGGGMVAVPLKEGMSAKELRQAAAGSSDANQARRLLALVDQN
jgi:hypothetical protein